MSFCQVTGKVSHANRRAALKAVGRRKGGIYCCRFCHFWHCTRQTKQDQDEIQHVIAKRPPGDWV